MVQLLHEEAKTHAAYYCKSMKSCNPFQQPHEKVLEKLITLDESIGQEV